MGLRVTFCNAFHLAQLAEQVGLAKVEAEHLGLQDNYLTPQLPDTWRQVCKKEQDDDGFIHSVLYLEP